MFQSEKHRYYEDKNFKALEMDYLGEQFCMGFILPNNVIPLEEVY